MPEPISWVKSLISSHPWLNLHLSHNSICPNLYRHFVSSLSLFKKCWLTEMEGKKASTGAHTQQRFKHTQKLVLTQVYLSLFIFRIKLNFSYLGPKSVPKFLTHVTQVHMSHPNFILGLLRGGTLGHYYFGRRAIVYICLFYLVFYCTYIMPVKVLELSHPSWSTSWKMSDLPSGCKRCLVSYHTW